MLLGKDMINLRLIRNQEVKNHLKIQHKDFLKNIEILFFRSFKKKTIFSQ